MLRRLCVITRPCSKSTAAKPKQEIYWRGRGQSRDGLGHGRNRKDLRERRQLNRPLTTHQKEPAPRQRALRRGRRFGGRSGCRRAFRAVPWGGTIVATVPCLARQSRARQRRLPFMVNTAARALSRVVEHEFTAR